MLDLVGQQLGQYRIEARVARGATSTIYKAYQEKLERSVAIKVLSPHFIDEPGFLDRFYQEARAVASLDHPNILPVYDFDQVGDIVYLVMKYVDTGTLRSVMGGQLDVPYTIKIVTQVGLALGYAHQQGVVHRDVKPGNILLADGNWALLADFGLAKIMQTNQRLTHTGTGVGTPEYMSPEQAQGKPTNGRADLYSLGVMLYEMLTGRLPFEGESSIAVALKHVSDPVKSPRKYRPDLPPALEQVILTALEKDPGRRYPTAETMLTALTRAASPLLTPEAMVQPVGVTQPIGRAAPAKSSRRLKLAAWWLALQQANRRAIGIVLGLVALLLGAAVITPALISGFASPTSQAATPVDKAVPASANSITSTMTSTPASAATPAITSTMELSTTPPGMLFIPAGSFTMGAVSGEFDADETPPHAVYLDDYYVDMLEVTNAQFARFVGGSGYQTDAEQAGDTMTWRAFNSADRQRFPVILISWNDAARYCAWMGKRLPTEAEWEKAARGATKHIYPWGDTFNSNAANTVEAGVGQPVAVASQSARSPYGLYDAVGNVWEHVQDWYGGGYYTDSPKANPRGPATGTFKVIRGGSFKTPSDQSTTTARETISPDSRGDDVGFRCAKDVK